MVNWKSKAFGDWLLLANGIVLIVLINMLCSRFFYRLDLTEEKRYSIKPQTKDILKNLDDKVYIEVFLEGEMNPEFRRFQKAIHETLEEFRIYSNNKVVAVYTDPSAALGEKARNEFMSGLAAKGIQPINVIDKQNGQRVEKLIFPGALISYGGAETGVMLLKGNKARTPEEEINQSIEGIEFELANAIYKLSSLDRKHIGLVKGHGELDSTSLSSFYSALIEIYDVTDTELDDDLSQYDALVIAKPTQRFSATDKYAWDQYVMNGGNTLLLIDKLEASMDSASRPGYFAFPYNTDLDDQLFKYGVRLNPDLIQDRNSALYPIVVRETGNKPQVQMLDWPFFPLINRYADHSTTRNLDAVILKFASSIDTVKALGIRKTPLLFTSQYSRTLTAPVPVNVNSLRKNINDSEFNKSYLPVAFLLEGKFTSLFKNRFLPEGTDANKFKSGGAPAKIIIVADGDIARNDVNQRTRQPLPLGFDAATRYTFANQDLLLNMIAYLADENGLIRTRNKEVKIRPLNRDRIADEKFKWQFINLAIPLIMLMAFGMGRSVLRKRKYAAFNE
jgi:ABC-2 type transport system permease protein